MTQGFITLPRRVLESGWYRQAPPFTRALWLLLLSLANWRPTSTARGQILQAGQLVTSHGSLARRLAWTENGRQEVPSKSRVRRALSALQNCGEIVIRADRAPSTRKPAQAHLLREIAQEPTQVETQTPTQAAAHIGITVTLIQWTSYAGGPSEAAHQPTQTAAQVATGGCAGDPAPPEQEDLPPAADAAWEGPKPHLIDPNRPGLTPRVRRINEKAERLDRESLQLIEEEEQRQRGHAQENQVAH